ncbi:Glycine--tRNA ligase beta subunit [Vibrio cholerae]|nr:Glycine--tRNA ligase beta subunit [Vibrio cholerae]
MRWGDKETQFIRPVKTLTILFGSELIQGEILGVASARTLRGHRFMGEAEFTIESAEQYPAILEERGKVIADYATRKAMIIEGSQQAAQQLGRYRGSGRCAGRRSNLAGGMASGDDGKI